MNNKNNSTNSIPDSMVQHVIEKKHQSPIQIYSSRRSHYPELHLFKNQIEIDGKGTLSKPYSSVKSSVMIYRTIFLSIGVLYFLLGLILFTKSLTWTCSLVFGSCVLVKTILCSLCSVSSIYCIALGLLIKHEKEAVKKVYNEYKTRLKRVHEKKAVKYGLKSFFVFGQEQRTSLALKQLYFDALERLQEYKDETMDILNRIADTESIDNDKREELYNQAILEFKDKMELAVNSFKTSNPPKLTHN